MRIHLVGRTRSDQEKVDYTGPSRNSRGTSPVAIIGVSGVLWQQTFLSHQRAVTRGWPSTNRLESLSRHLLCDAVDASTTDSKYATNVKRHHVTTREEFADHLHDVTVCIIARHWDYDKVISYVKI